MYNFTLVPMVPYPAGSCPDMITVGDFNNDHLLDIVLIDRSSNKFGIIFGNGDRTFQAQMTYATGPSPYSVVVGNFNNDNRLRILLLFKCLIGMYKNYQ
jgi:hypothetical protein